MTGYTIFLNGKYFDTVFFGKKTSCEEVKKSLVDHDGYPDNIVVKAERV